MCSSGCVNLRRQDIVLLLKRRRAPGAGVWTKLARHIAQFNDTRQMRQMTIKKSASSPLYKLEEKSGEPVRVRTGDLLIKSQLLYQLSYRPTGRGLETCRVRVNPHIA